MKKGKRKMILRLTIFVVVILMAISYIPVKKAVYADKDDERSRSKQGIFYWKEKVWADHMECIIETTDLADCPKLKKSGWRYIREDDADETLIYFETGTYEYEGYVVKNRSPLVKLNNSFDPSKVKNYFAITYEEAYWLDGEEGDGYYVVPIYIFEWTPIYPIQRSGTLANLLLPKSYLTIWDFIG